jgi:hypothetical protein
VGIAEFVFSFRLLLNFLSQSPTIDKQIFTEVAE